MTNDAVRMAPSAVVVVFVLVLVRARFAHGADAAESGRREPFDDTPAAPPDGGEEDTPAPPAGWSNTPAAPAGDEDTPAAPAAATAAELPAPVCWLFCANQAKVKVLK